MGVLRNGGMNPAADTQNRLKPVEEVSYNLIHQVSCISGGFESAFATDHAPRATYHVPRLSSAPSDRRLSSADRSPLVRRP
jgi:hypothetical protein